MHLAEDNNALNIRQDLTIQSNAIGIGGSYRRVDDDYRLLESE